MAESHRTKMDSRLRGEWTIFLLNTVDQAFEGPSRPLGAPSAKPISIANAASN